MVRFRVQWRTDSFDADRYDMHSPSTIKDVLAVKPDFSHLHNNNKNRLEMTQKIEDTSPGFVLIQNRFLKNYKLTTENKHLTIKNRTHSTSCLVTWKRRKNAEAQQLVTKKPVQDFSKPYNFHSCQWGAWHPGLPKPNPQLSPPST